MNSPGRSEVSGRGRSPKHEPGCRDHMGQPGTARHLYQSDHRAKIPRVVLGWREPDLFVTCEGVALLTAAGVEVVEMPQYAAQARSANAHTSPSDVTTLGGVSNGTTSDFARSTLESASTRQHLPTCPWVVAGG